MGRGNNALKKILFSQVKGVGNGLTTEHVFVNTYPGVSGAQWEADPPLNWKQKG